MDDDENIDQVQGTEDDELSPEEANDLSGSLRSGGDRTDGELTEDLDE